MWKSPTRSGGKSRFEIEILRPIFSQDYFFDLMLVGDRR